MLRGYEGAYDYRGVHELQEKQKEEERRRA